MLSLLIRLLLEASTETILSGIVGGLIAAVLIHKLKLAAESEDLNQVVDVITAMSEEQKDLVKKALEQPLN